MYELVIFRCRIRSLKIPEIKEKQFYLYPSYHNADILLEILYRLYFEYNTEYNAITLKYLLIFHFYFCLI